VCEDDLVYFIATIFFFVVVSTTSQLFTMTYELAFINLSRIHYTQAKLFSNHMCKKIS